MKRTTSVALSGLGVPETLRWHEGALWFSDLAHGTVHRWDGTGQAETVVKVPGRAGGLGWLPDGRMLVASMDGGIVHRQEANGEFVEHADLRHLVGGPVNDMLVAPQGRAYVGNFGFDYYAFVRERPNAQLYAPPGPRKAPLACLAPDGTLLGVTEPLLFPNGCLLTPDGTTMIAAETLGMRLVSLSVERDGTLGPPRPWAPLVPAWLWHAVNHPDSSAASPAPSRRSSTGLSSHGVPPRRSPRTTSPGTVTAKRSGSRTPCAANASGWPREAGSSTGSGRARTP
ncbi:SMP-30/gluconolactonase/LRE family protein [Streptomyces spongiae]|uniref:SMP-30/gluconolactonase/LRE family protein n=1 Tax=Streptomyces spongiae TaxID=565072 RepID=UPI001D142B3F|nr:SMP-30/gluconolactonase/LRE family protein [Streptomyces spongiae]